MRELVWRAESKQFDDWNHTAFLAAMMANLQRGPDTAAVKMEHFHPFLNRGGSLGGGGLSVTVDNVDILARAMFGKSGDEPP